MSKDIHQKIFFKAKPHDVYEILMDEEKHAKLTDSTTHLSKIVGEEFAVFDGTITGKNLELIPDQKIIQTWRYDDWPENVYSTITFLFEEKDGGTEMIFTQIGVPDDKYDDISQGWADYYWQPMHEMLEGK
jgi:activator of HSP90 ATPase